MQIIAPLVALAGMCAAHFSISSPAPRSGTDELTELVAPCGGLPLGARTSITPVDGVFHITGELEHPSAPANFSIVVGDADPAADAFGKTFLGYNVTEYEGDFDFAANITGVPGIVDGANAVIRVEMETDDGHLNVCMDVTFVLPASTAATATTTAAVTSSAATDAAKTSPVYAVTGGTTYTQIGSASVLGASALALASAMLLA